MTFQRFSWVSSICIRTSRPARNSSRCWRNTFCRAPIAAPDRCQPAVGRDAVFAPATHASPLPERHLVHPHRQRATYLHTMHRTFIVIPTRLRRRRTHHEAPRRHHHQLRTFRTVTELRPLQTRQRLSIPRRFLQYIRIALHRLRRTPYLDMPRALLKPDVHARDHFSTTRRPADARGARDDFVLSLLPVKSSTKRRRFSRRPAFGSGYAGLVSTSTKNPSTSPLANSTLVSARSSGSIPSTGWGASATTAKPARSSSCSRTCSGW